MKAGGDMPEIEKKPRSECVLEMRDIIEDNLHPINASLQLVSAELCRLSSYQVQATEQYKVMTECVKRHDNLLLGEHGGNGINGDVRAIKQGLTWAKSGLVALWTIIGGTGLFKVIQMLIIDHGNAQ